MYILIRKLWYHSLEWPTFSTFLSYQHYHLAQSALYSPKLTHKKEGPTISTRISPSHTLSLCRSMSGFFFSPHFRLGLSWEISETWVFLFLTWVFSNLYLANQSFLAKIVSYWLKIDLSFRKIGLSFAKNGPNLIFSSTWVFLKLMKKKPGLCGTPLHNK